MTYRIHPAAKLMPLMTAEEFAELKADIKKARPPRAYRALQSKSAYLKRPRISPFEAASPSGFVGPSRRTIQSKWV